MTGTLRPSQVCGALLAALEASEGRRRSRKRDQTPDAIGLGVKRDLLAQAVRQDPEPAEFEAFLLRYVEDREGACFPGAVSAMARIVLDEWRLANAMGDFAAWLGRGAPSEDAVVSASATPPSAA